jgi:uncharacterized protein
VAAAFLDTSALVRRYVRSEPGGDRVRSLCAPAHHNLILVARMTSVEVASALARKLRERELRRPQRDSLWRLFMAHWRDQYLPVAATDDVHATAESLLFRYPLRAFDALQLASALAVRQHLSPTPLEFWTADLQQAQAARAEALVVEVLG